jgi:hypothetical protein
MQYKLKTEPEVVYYMETKECTIEDKNGVQQEIRFSEHSKGSDFFILEDGIWKEIIERNKQNSIHGLNTIFLENCEELLVVFDVNLWFLEFINPPLSSLLAYFANH